ncbi:glycosyltransferase family 2 protein [Lentibacter sp. XHP0401]|jgi:GT2 family glycosyltransferase|uniref:glycosyltransferase family 2 protein n=1 Tax=Lentibacter sp. XHP0401 TaxID=2984334 RepID=UPI0021E8D9C9|nr:glycosyltransferase family 2 protein [Lentibacter sp. XHP0401]MCV2893390.1 glycosyltransferase family 2 protein [Lentibacter sp. XHP0401]
MSAPSILAVILNYRTPGMTLQSAEAALRELEGLNAELVIVDNDSGDGSFKALQEGVTANKWPVRVLQSGHNGGFGAGNNFGMRAGLSSGQAPDYYYILNSDAFPDKGSIRALRDYLVKHPNVGFAGSYIHGPEGDPHQTAFRFPSALGELEASMRFGPVSRLLRNYIVPLPVPDETVMVDWLAGASMMMRAQTLDEIGLFDETFFLYFEETDLCCRASLAGWPTVYVRESEVTHIGSVSTGMKEWSRVPDYWFDSRWHYFTKNHGIVYAAYATLLHLAGGAFYRLRRFVERKPRDAAPYFLRHLAGHAFRSLFARRPSENVPALAARPAPQGDST